MRAGDPSRPPRRLARQRGVVLASVMAVMAVTMLLAAGVITHFAVQEARAIEGLYAEERVYWAMTGHAAALRARAWRAGDGLCGSESLPEPCGSDAALAASLDALLADGPDGVWSVDALDFALTAEVTDPTPSPTPDDGRVRLVVMVEPGAAPRLIPPAGYRPLVVDLCLDGGGGVCASDPAGADHGRLLVTAAFRLDPVP